jgi:hypothetical protein
MDQGEIMTVMDTMLKVSSFNHRLSINYVQKQNASNAFAVSSFNLT